MTKHPQSKPTCRTCAWFEVGECLRGFGECRFAPPVIDHDDEEYSGRWPVIKDDRWCSNHEPTGDDAR